MKKGILSSRTLETNETNETNFYCTIDYDE